MKFKVLNRSLFSLISFFLGTSFFFLSRPRQKIKIGKNKREFLIYEKMEKRLEDEIDEIVEKEIQNVRKSAEKYQLGNIYFYQLGDVNMETFNSCLFPSFHMLPS